MPEQYDKIGILVQGDSFGEGLIHDIEQIYPYENLYFIRRGNYTADDFDMAQCLDQVDAVVMEANEAELTGYSYGFLDYLIGFLPTYQPQVRSGDCIEKLDFKDPAVWDTGALRGFYGDEGGLSWVMDYSQVTLQSEAVKENGLQIDFKVPKNLFKRYDDDEVTIYVNGKAAYKNRFTEKWSGSVVIGADQLHSRDDVYCIEIICSRTYVPRETKKNSEDARELAIQIRYVGEVR